MDDSYKKALMRDTGSITGANDIGRSLVTALEKELSKSFQTSTKYKCKSRNMRNCIISLIKEKKIKKPVIVFSWNGEDIIRTRKHFDIFNILEWEKREMTLGEGKKIKFKHINLEDIEENRIYIFDGSKPLGTMKIMTGKYKENQNDITDDGLLLYVGNPTEDSNLLEKMRNFDWMKKKFPKPNQKEEAEKYLKKRVVLKIMITPKFEKNKREIYHINLPKNKNPSTS